MSGTSGTALVQHWYKKKDNNNKYLYLIFIYMYHCTKETLHARVRRKGRI